MHTLQSRFRSWFVISLASVLPLLTLSGVRAGNPPFVRFTPFGSSLATSLGTGINNSGRISGFGTTSLGTQRGVRSEEFSEFIFPSGVLEPLSGFTRSAGGGIDGLGRVVGSASKTVAGVTVSQAVVWNDNSTAAISLGSFGGDDSAALDVSDEGVIVGYARRPDLSYSAFVTLPGGSEMLMPDFGAEFTTRDTAATAAAGDFVGGQIVVDGVNRGFVGSRSGKSYQLLPTGGNSHTLVEAVNRRGDAAGAVGSSSTNRRPAVWVRQTDSSYVLTFPFADTEIKGRIEDLNDSRDFAGVRESAEGSRAMGSINGAPFADLTALAPVGFTLVTGTGINDAGDITGSSSFSGQALRPYVLSRARGDLEIRSLTLSDVKIPVGARTLCNLTWGSSTFIDVTGQVTLEFPKSLQVLRASIPGLKTEPGRITIPLKGALFESQLRVTFVAASGAGSTGVVRATIAGDLEDTDPADNSASVGIRVTDPPASSVDLKMSKITIRPTPDLTVPSEIVFQAQNGGSQVAAEMVMSAELDPGFFINQVSASPGGRFELKGGLIEARFSRVPKGATRNLVVRVDSGGQPGPFGVTGRVTGAGVDPNLSNNILRGTWKAELPNLTCKIVSAEVRATQEFGAKREGVAIGIQVKNAGKGGSPACAAVMQLGSGGGGDLGFFEVPSLAKGQQVTLFSPLFVSNTPLAGQTVRAVVDGFQRVPETSESDNTGTFRLAP